MQSPSKLQHNSSENFFNLKSHMEIPQTWNSKAIPNKKLMVASPLRCRATLQSSSDKTAWC